MYLFPIFLSGCAGEKLKGESACAKLLIFFVCELAVQEFWPGRWEQKICQAHFVLAQSWCHARFFLLGNREKEFY